MEAPRYPVNEFNDFEKSLLDIREALGEDLPVAERERLLERKAEIEEGKNNFLQGSQGEAKIYDQTRQEVRKFIDNQLAITRKLGKNVKK